MGWQPRRGVQVLDPTDPLPDLNDDQLRPYLYCSVPVHERPHPTTCGRPGTGHKAHARLGEPPCHVCRTAAAEYSRRRNEERRYREAQAAAAAERARVLKRACEARSRRRRKLRALVDRFDLDYPEYALQSTRGGAL